MVATCLRPHLARHVAGLQLRRGLATAGASSLLQRPELRAIGEEGPVFWVSGSHVQVTDTPRAFYDKVKRGIQRAQRRIVLASLYLGTGQLEQDLLRELHAATQRGVEVHVLLDGLRGTRGSPSSATMLAPLLAEAPAHTRVSLYRTPLLRGLWGLLPERLNEGAGLQHMKIYIVDDSTMFSGANLSDWYFVDRQDRYVTIHQPQLADFCASLVDTVAGHSLQLAPDASLGSPAVGPHPAQDAEGHIDSLRVATSRLISSAIRDNRPTGMADADTLVVPLVQMGAYSISHDSSAVLPLLQGAPTHSRLAVAAGYLNFPKQYTRALLEGQADVSVLTAAPQANGFFTASGISRHIPAAYSCIEAKFLQHVASANQTQRIAMHEYARLGWTFHAKGLWYFLPGDNLPCCTLVGSPNFGMRSARRDLEAQAAIVTTHSGLRAALMQEHERLYADSTCVDLATVRRRVDGGHWWVGPAAAAIKHLL
eukprot:comp20786_c0_seq1/m.27305 comp20786_c0_seq1/g.27305  ORF comp20786_c0_seq1/g.27305 comp20786_c0_seq1/m.27305 type:complete len:482 (-) comp20786_c0_seq1:192-1637(-)